VIITIPAVAVRPDARPWSPRAAYSMDAVDAKAKPIVASANAQLAVTRILRGPKRSERSPAGNAAIKPNSGYAAESAPAPAFDRSYWATKIGSSGTNAK